MRLITFTILLFAALSIQAQKDFTPGAIITLKKDTVRGEVKDIHPIPLHYMEKIKFRTEGETVKTFNAESLVGYFKGSKVFKSVSLPKGRTLFMQEVQPGENLQYFVYTYQDKTKRKRLTTRRFLSFDGANLFEVRGPSFKRTVRKKFSETPELIEKVNDKTFKFKDLQKLVIYYNQLKATK